MAEHSTEKSPVDSSDYEGLQLDTRAVDNTDKTLNPFQGYSDEKAYLSQTTAIRGPPRSNNSAATTTDGVVSAVTDDSIASPEPKKRICGLRRQTFWILLSVILAIAVVAAIVGGLVGGLRHSSAAKSNAHAPAPAATSSSAPTPTLAPVDVMVGSPLEVLSFPINGTGESPAGDQAFRLFYQSVNGNIKVMVCNGTQLPWHDATPIFTDAINNTGLAVITYMNNAGARQSSIFYIDNQGNLREKRSWADQPWELGSLSNQNFKVVGSGPLPAGANPMNDPSNNWDSYSLAAAYSPKFGTGSEGRLFYHYTATNGSQWVQELLWNQTADVWTSGQVITDAWPNSHLSAVIDDTHQMLRLFYSSGNLTLKESWTDLNNQNATYRAGVQIPSILAHDDAAIAAVAINGDVLVYHYVAVDIIGIRELNISGTPGSQNDQESYNVSEAVVAQPALVSQGRISVYQPIGASVTNVSGLDPSIYVFFAEGTLNATSGYQRLMEVNKPAANLTWPPSSLGNADGQVQLPLGDQCANLSASWTCPV
ncbi:hypothetical protein LPUS_06915 [Lasallia pustulata]|uniref:Fucose-specific lectin n=1 Tax=Lasallia pustulata TaxID=136370 RepID=A0A1W5D220_9LECA|nr:hypothetical protein LPUS_06915 [Lasallia pustulata]